MRERDGLAEQVNPFIGFSDLLINFVLVLIFFLSATALLGRIGWDEIRYKEIQADVRSKIEGRLSSYIQHDIHNPNTGQFVPLSRYRNDPPGAQRWVIQSSILFYPDSADLTPEGLEQLKILGELLKEHHVSAKSRYGDKWLEYTWRRIRIEGHTRPTRPSERENWSLAALRAAKVAEVLGSAGIPAWHMAVAARGGQTPFLRELRSEYENPVHERVELILEYAAVR